MSTSASSSEERTPVRADTLRDESLAELPRPIAHAEDDIPRMEPWLWVVLPAFVPGLLSFILPRTLMPLLFGASAVLIATGVALFAVQEVRKRRGAQVRPASR